MIEKDEPSLRDLWDNIKLFNMYVFGVPKGEEKKNRIENLFQIPVF